MKLDIIELNVKNWEAMIEWYVSNLNLKVVAREDDHKYALLAGSDGAMLGLFGVRNLLMRGSGGFIPYFRTEKLGDVVSNLKSKSVNIEDTQVQHWGEQAKVKDPEGNEFYLYEER
ncbi:VOC family protein [Candidatus Gottesmanbacteria bacterium]|nr:VOC family protein [Candidatus Gottesmanbacteria bacterium]